MRRALINRVLSLMLCGSLLTCTIVAAAPVTGKVAVAGKGVAAVRVVAHPVSVLTLTGEAPFASAPTGADGLFTLDLPPGSYYLLADGAGLFGYYGRNPLTVPEEGAADVNILLVPVNSRPPQLTSTLTGGIIGRVVHDGKGVPGALVFVYPDLSAQLKGFGLGMSAPSDGDGVFELPLPAGSYYLVARARHGGSLAGPLQAGDLFGYLPGNPVVVAAGAVVQMTLPVIAVPEKSSRIAATLFGRTRIGGIVVDGAGQPQAGMMALLYSDDAMLNRPLYVSPPTGADGRFQLSFPSGGAFYLAARSSLGGTPSPGEMYGRYLGETGPVIRIETGKAVEGLQIVVEPVW